MLKFIDKIKFKEWKYFEKVFYVLEDVDFIVVEVCLLGDFSGGVFSDFFF